MSDLTTRAFDPRAFVHSGTHYYTHFVDENIMDGRVISKIFCNIFGKLWKRELANELNESKAGRERVRKREIVIEWEGERRKNRLNEHYFRIYQTQTDDGAAVAADGWGSVVERVYRRIVKKFHTEFTYISVKDILLSVSIRFLCTYPCVCVCVCVCVYVWTNTYRE